MQTDDCLVRGFTGNLGSGKSYNAVVRALDALMCGMKLVTNVVLDWDEVNRYCKAQGCKAGIPRENYVYFDTTEIAKDVDKLLDLLCKNCLLLFDEVHLVLDSRNWKDNANLSGGLQVLMTQARKFQVEMIFISQSDKNMDGRIVRQCTNLVKHFNWRHFPVLGDLLPFPISIAKWCSNDGRTVQSRGWIWRKKAIYRCYKSSQAFCGLELKGEGPRAVIGQKKKKLGYAFTVGVAGLLCVIAQWVLDWKRGPQKAPEVKIEPVAKKKAVQYAEAPKPIPEPPRVVQPVRLERDLCTRFEATLPRLRKAAAFGLVCDNYTIRPGTTLGLGTVRSWRIDGDCVTVFTTSPEMPELRLFYASNPLLCTSLGTPVRRVRGVSNGDNIPLPQAVLPVAPLRLVPEPAASPLPEVVPYVKPPAFATVAP